MNDNDIRVPGNFPAIRSESEKIKFSMPSDLQTGSLLRTLVASKPNGKFLELGTGTGLSLSWIVEAMDSGSTVITIDNNEDYISIAGKYFGKDPRVTIICEDGNKWIEKNQDLKFDLIFADAWPGKYEKAEETFNLLEKGGFYIIDDMLPQPNWPEGHEENVTRLLGWLDTRTDIRLTNMNWSTGIIIVTKIK
ncbi:MAG TPA: class I SAM-dependent methyltransferase [Puia sp.]|nr:class I SAM-dependent methyltransferase [Puia sp.]